MHLEKLQVREITVVILFCSIILSICLISLKHSEGTSTHDFSPASADTILVEVVGAVKHPGKYTVSKQTAIPQLIDQSQPLDNAVIYPSMKLQKNEKGESFLAIPTTGAVLVHIRGSISEAGWKSLPEKTRICDIPDFLALNENYDKKFLKRKRQLRNGEFLLIP